jgi:hypothetical protein
LNCHIFRGGNCERTKMSIDNLVQIYPWLRTHTDILIGCNYVWQEIKRSKKQKFWQEIYFTFTSLSGRWKSLCVMEKKENGDPLFFFNLILFIFFVGKVLVDTHFRAHLPFFYTHCTDYRRKNKNCFFFFLSPPLLSSLRNSRSCVCLYSKKKTEPGVAWEIDSPKFPSNDQTHVKWAMMDII